jgi:hypothetical protein
MALLLRTLTLKSKLGFGYSEYKYLTISDLIIIKKEFLLIQYYYELSMINYNDELIDILCITKIPKPGKVDKKQSIIYTKESMSKLNEKRTLNDLSHELRVKRESKDQRLIKKHFIHGNGQAELMRKNRGL